MDKNILDTCNMLHEIAWYFGNRGFEEKCCEDLSFIEYMALKTANQNKTISIQDIGNTLNFTKSGATRIIDRLENKGYVIRERSARDGRVCCVSVTEKGIEAISRIMENYTAHLEDVLKEFGPQKIQEIRDTLEFLVNAVQQNKPLIR